MLREKISPSLTNVRNLIRSRDPHSERGKMHTCDATKKKKSIDMQQYHCVIVGLMCYFLQRIARVLFNYLLFSNNL